MTLQKINQLLPGISVAMICGLAAMFLSEHYATPVMLLALLIGIALAFLYDETKCREGINFISSHALRIGVALIGLRISISDLVDLGWLTIFMLLAAVVSTILLGVILSKLFGLSKEFGVLTGGSVGICGASAALAISSVLPDSKHKERDTLLTVIGVTILSTFAMVLYPIVASILDFDTTQTGIFLGATIHDVAQVVGAGYSVSTETGDLATLIKLVRVSILVPIVFMILLSFSRRQQSKNNTAPLLPRFLIAFILLMIINSIMDIPKPILQYANDFSRLALILAIAAIGMKSNLRQLLEVGLKPILIMVLETSWIAGLVICALLYL